MFSRNGQYRNTRQTNGRERYNKITSCEGVAYYDALVLNFIRVVSREIPAVLVYFVVRRAPIAYFLSGLSGVIKQ